MPTRFEMLFPTTRKFEDSLVRIKTDKLLVMRDIIDKLIEEMKRTTKGMWK